MAKYVIGDNANLVTLQRASEGSLSYTGDPIYLQPTAAMSLIHATAGTAVVEGQAETARNGSVRVLIRVRLAAPNLVARQTGEARDSAVVLDPVSGDQWSQQEITIHTVLTVPKKLVDVLRATGAADTGKGSSVMTTIAAALNTLSSVSYGSANPLLSLSATVGTVQQGRLDVTSPFIRGLLGMTPVDTTYEQALATAG